MKTTVDRYSYLHMMFMYTCIQVVLCILYYLKSEIYLQTESFHPRMKIPRNMHKIATEIKLKF